MRNAGVKGHGLLSSLFYCTVSANSFFAFTEVIGNIMDPVANLTQ